MGDRFYVSSDIGHCGYDAQEASPRFANDGQFWDSGRTITVDGQSKPAYDQMIKDRFRFTQDNFAEAFREAAKKGHPIVAVLGSWKHNNSRALIQDSLPQADPHGDEAIYVYLEASKCTGSLADYVNRQLSGGHNAAITLVYPVKPGKDGQPEPGNVLYRWRGEQTTCCPDFMNAIQTARHTMDSYRDKFAQPAPTAPKVAEKKPDGAARKEELQKLRQEVERWKQEAAQLRERSAASEKKRAQTAQMAATEIAKLRNDIKETRRTLDELYHLLKEIRKRSTQTPSIGQGSSDKSRKHGTWSEQKLDRRGTAGGKTN